MTLSVPGRSRVGGGGRFASGFYLPKFGIEIGRNFSPVFGLGFPIFGSSFPLYFGFLFSREKILLKV